MALANAARAAVEAKEPSSARELAALGREALEPLPASRLLAYLQISLARVLLDLGGAKDLIRAEALLRTSTDTAESLGDAATASHAWGALGRAAELKGRLSQALTLTRRALSEAQKAEQPASLYRWQWQLGRIHRALGHRSTAIEAMRGAVWTLAAIRADLPCTYARPQRSFRQEASAICFQLVDLLLEKDAACKGHGQAILREVRELVELLKVYELREYFRDDCLDASRTRSVPLDAISRTAVVVYPILLEDRTELLVSLPGGLKRYTVPVGRDRLTQELLAFRARLEKRTTHEYLAQARRLYGWLIAPLEDDLSRIEAKTLVFVPDGHLRTVPLGALHDGRRFLIQRFATAVTPGLDLTDPEPISEEQRCLIAGMTVSRQGFPPIPHVHEELRTLGALYPHDLMVNEAFRVPRLKERLVEGSFTMVHLASHGQFKEDINDSYILTYDSRLDLDLLDRAVGFLRFRDEPLEHLTLSACQTAAGEDRAALGLAGVAVKAGARSALATLWHINDQASAELVSEFYRQLKAKGTSRAAALRRAKLRLLEDDRYAHPGYWSPFLLINSWL